MAGTRHAIPLSDSLTEYIALFQLRAPSHLVMPWPAEGGKGVAPLSLFSACPVSPPKLSLRLSVSRFRLSPHSSFPCVMIPGCKAFRFLFFVSVTDALLFLSVARSVPTPYTPQCGPQATQ